MNYTLHQLNIFLEIAKYQSLTKAAESLYLTQPAISIQLKKLQEQFDIPLTETIGKKIHLTSFGEKILIVAKQISSLSDEIQNLTGSHKNQLIGKIKLSSVSTGKYVLPYFISSFLEENDSIELQLNVTNRDDVIQDLSNNDVDFSIVSIPPDRIKYESLELFDNEIVLVVSSKVDAKPNDLNIFQQIPLIYREKGSGTRKLLEQYISKQKIKKLKKIELQSNEAIKQAVLAGLGMSLIPLVSIKNELELHQLKIIPMPGLPLFSKWSLVWTKGKNHGIAARNLLQNIELNKDKIIQDQFSWLNH